MSALRPIALYLPQFHPIPENDEWWGKGFTEWTNVTRAEPLFEGHYQPQLPTDMGFYDLRLNEVMQEQAKLATGYGIAGFCFYHYWFNGHLLLEKPLHNLLETGKPDFPFMMCWANENWSRRWDGREQEVLMKQDYSAEDDVKHIQYLLQFLQDPRYIRIDGKCVLAIYRLTLLPDPAATIRIWREEARKAGIELYLVHFENWDWRGAKMLDYGLDAGVEFAPHYQLVEYLKKHPIQQPSGMQKKMLRLLHKTGIRKKKQTTIYPYDWILQGAEMATYDYKRFPAACPSWDNTARRKEAATIFDGSSPEKFAQWLQIIRRKFKPYSKEENLVFINAWNEWAEGNHLEPCIKYGRQFLEAVKNNL